VKFEKRSAVGLTITTSYTLRSRWTRRAPHRRSAPTDSPYFQSSSGLWTIGLRPKTQLSYRSLYELPIGAKKNWGNNWSGVLDKVAADGRLAESRFYTAVFLFPAWSRAVPLSTQAPILKRRCVQLCRERVPADAHDSTMFNVNAFRVATTPRFLAMPAGTRFAGQVMSPLTSVLSR